MKVFCALPLVSTEVMVGCESKAASSNNTNIINPITSQSILFHKSYLTRITM